MITKLFEEETPREDPVAKSAIPGRIMTQTSSGMGDESGSSGFPRHSANVSSSLIIVIATKDGKERIHPKLPTKVTSVFY